jgi:hypothetical protein
MAEVLHLVTQRGQPYGSVRMCCEECGVMVRGASVYWTDSPQLYNDPPTEYINCKEASRNINEVAEIMDE